MTRAPKLRRNNIRRKQIEARRLRHALQAHCPRCGALAGTRCPKTTLGFHEDRADLAFQQRMTAGK